MRKFALFFFIFFVISLFSQVKLKLIDSLKTQLKTSVNDSVRAKILRELTKHYTAISTDSAAKYGKQGVIAIQKLNDKIYLAKHLNNLAYVYMVKGDSKECTKYFKKSLKIYEEEKDTIGQGKIFANISANYMQFDLLDSAMIYGLKAKKIFELKGLENYINFVDSNLASIYEGMHNYEKALEYNLKSLNASLKSNDLEGVGISYNNTAETYYKLDSINKAEFYYKKAIKTGEEIEDYFLLGSALCNLSNLYLKENKLNLGVNYAERAIEYKNYLNSERQEASLNYILGELYFKQRKFDKANNYFNKSIKYFQSNNDLRKVAQIKRYQSVIYSNLNRKKTSIQLLLESDSINKKLNELESNEQLQKIEVKYETEKKERELLQTRTEKAETELALSNTKNWIYILLTILIAGLGIFFTITQRNKRKAQEEITKEKEKGFKAIINAQEEERNKIARELHDGVVQQIGSVILKSRNLFNNKGFKDDKAAKEVLESLENSNQDLRNISHQMMPRALKELGILPALQDLLDGSLTYSDIKYSLEHFNIETRLPEKIEVTIYRITQELINNIIKHSKATEVSVQLFKNENNIILIVEDNGVGFSKKASTKGIGLLNISSRLDMVKGKVNFEPSPNSGTLVTINIPL